MMDTIKESVQDMIGRDISVGDLVVSYNHIYQIMDLVPKGGRRTGCWAGDQVKMMIFPKGANSKTKWSLGRECIILPKEEITMWLLKKNPGLF